MNFAFPWPYSQGEWLAWAAAAITVALGLIAVFAPRFTLRSLGLRSIDGRAGGLAAARAQLGGFYIGIGLAAILFAQPLVYMALGAAWALAALGRIVSITSDRGGTFAIWIGLFATLALAALPLAFALGFIR